jgi:ABC-type multidrug transport system ATPase subunit/pSer/pThr/pTyr-binding forkhead associated (FHA) protein
MRVSALGHEVTVTATEPLTIGRDPSNVLVCPDPRVSRHHAFVRWHEGTWWLQDRGSHNATFLNGQRVSDLAIQGPVRVLLGDPHSGVAIDLEPLTAAAAHQEVLARHYDGTQLGTLAAIHHPSGRFRIGRSADNDVVLADLAASRHHAELAWDSGWWVLTDLGSSNGTYVNGQRTSHARITDADLVGIGTRTFRLHNGTLEEWVPGGELSFEALSLLTRAPSGQVLLDDISFALPKRSLLAAVGPSGAGKSTLLGALTGMRPASHGRVVYGGRDLYTHYAELRQQVGYVPQDDILHPQLSVRRALRYAAELRFGPDVARAERERRVEEVLAELGLTERAGLQVGRLSGGQRKRVSIALELLTQPSLLFLDEPTSGLDPGMEKQVMRLLRELADGGRTVIVVTHSVQSLDLCDRILFIAPGGRLAYFGPTDRALPYFNCPDLADVFSSLEQRRDVDWKVQFRASPVYRQYVAEPLADLDGHGNDAAAAAVVSEKAARRQGPLRQLSTLTRRYVRVILSDRLNVALLLLQAPILGLIVMLADGDSGFVRGSPDAYVTATQVALFLAICATYLGAGNAIREIVKELPVYARERAIGLSIPAYLGSKVLVLSVVTVFQGVVLVLVGAQRQGGGGLGAVLPLRPELSVDVAAAGMAALGLGLLVSALVSRADKALTLLPLLLVPQLVLAFPQLKVDEKPVLAQLSYVASARWGYDAIGATVGFNQLLYTRAVRFDPRVARGANPDAGDPSVDRAVETAAGQVPRPRWRNQPLAWGSDLAWLGGLFIIELVGAGWALRRRDPSRKR